MDTLHATKSIRSSLKLLAVLVIFSGIMMTVSTGVFVLNFKALGFSIFSGAQRGVFAVFNSIENTITAIGQLATLQEEYQILSEKVEDYEFLQRSNAEIRKENERLTELLGFTQTYSYKTQTARIIGRDPESLYSGITLDKGARDGIVKNMPVIAIQNGNVGLVGKVITVGRYTSFIMPIYDFNSHVSARIQNTRDLGLVSGNGSADGALTLSYIKKRVMSDLQYGDMIVTSGENDNYMRETTIGTISNIEVVDYDTSLIISIMPIIDFARLEEVVIVDTGTLNETTQNSGAQR